MTRLFVGLEIPEVVADALSTLQSGLEGARWRPIENFHITLAFIGEVDRHGFDQAIDALAEVKGAPFELTLSGLDFFGARAPHSVWAGVAPSPSLLDLQSSIERKLRRAGFDLEKRKFTPHVTLAYLKNTPADFVASYCARHGLFSCGPFPVENFHLYSSTLGAAASHYEIEASYSLSFSR